jgi:hypothetical protein
MPGWEVEVSAPRTRRFMPLVECPVCHRPVPVYRVRERLHRHHADGALCPGSGLQVDLYGDNA